MNSLVRPNYSVDEYHFVVQVLRSLAVSDQPESESLMHAHIDSNEWLSHIYNYLKFRSFLDDYIKNTLVRIQKISTHYIILSYIVYHKSYNGVLIRCLKKERYLFPSRKPTQALEVVILAVNIWCIS